MNTLLLILFHSSGILYVLLIVLLVVLIVSIAQGRGLAVSGPLGLVLIILLVLLLAGCGSPVTLSGAYQDDRGSRYEAGATFTLPTKGGYLK